MSKPWTVTVRNAEGRTLARVEVDAETRRAAKAAGIMQATRALAGHPVARIVGRVSAVGGGPASATAAPLGNPARTLARRLRGAMSPRMAYVMGGILGVDFGARDRYGNACGRIVVTSDGFALGAMGNAFLGAVSDIRANVSGLLDHVNATPREREHAERCYRERVTRS